MSNIGTSIKLKTGQFEVGQVFFEKSRQKTVTQKTQKNNVNLRGRSHWKTLVKKFKPLIFSPYLAQFRALF